MATPGNFGGGNTVPGQVFLGITDNGGTAKRAGAARGGRPEPCAAKAEPPGHKARGDESGSQSRFPFRNPQQVTSRFRPATSNARGLQGHRQEKEG
jgi:hypothetical protein